VVLSKQAAQLDAIIALFDQLFLGSHNTRLISGAEEPVYLPADMPDNKQSQQNQAGGTAYHRLCFRQDYLSSALHEIAHWCLAGTQRLLLEDFGYWYQPDGRSAEQQQVFEAVEVRPQALEWMFSVACGQRFQPSADNLSGGQSQPSGEFSQAVMEQAKSWCEVGTMPSRAEQFLAALVERFALANPRDQQHYR
jgi:elongation factor P hydroxylase